MLAKLNPVSAPPQTCTSTEGGSSLDTTWLSLAGAPVQRLPLYAAKRISVRCARGIAPVASGWIRASIQNRPGEQLQRVSHWASEARIANTFGRALC